MVAHSSYCRERGRNRINRAEGRILRDRRKELGLTQEEVALELGMSIHQYQRYEYGESEMSNTRMKTGLRICAILQLNPFEIIIDAKRPSPHTDREL